MGVSDIEPPPVPGSLAVLLRPDQRLERNERAFLLGGRSEASVHALALQERGRRPAHCRPSVRSAEGKQCVERREQVGAGPGPVRTLMAGDHSPKSLGPPVTQLGNAGQRVDSSDDSVSTEVAVPVGPLFGELEQADEVAFDESPIIETSSQGSSKCQTTHGKAGGGLGPKHLAVRKHERGHAMFGWSG